MLVSKFVDGNDRCSAINSARSGVWLALELWAHEGTNEMKMSILDVKPKCALEFWSSEFWVRLTTLLLLLLNITCHKKKKKKKKLKKKKRKQEHACQTFAHLLEINAKETKHKSLHVIKQIMQTYKKFAQKKAKVNTLAFFAFFREGVWHMSGLFFVFARKKGKEKNCNGFCINCGRHWPCTKKRWCCFQALCKRQQRPVPALYTSMHSLSRSMCCFLRATTKAQGTFIELHFWVKFLLVKLSPAECNVQASDIEERHNCMCSITKTDASRSDELSCCSKKEPFSYSHGYSRLDCWKFAPKMSLINRALLRRK